MRNVLFRANSIFRWRANFFFFSIAKTFFASISHTINKLTLLETLAIHQPLGVNVFGCNNNVTLSPFIRLSLTNCYEEKNERDWEQETETETDSGERQVAAAASALTVANIKLLFPFRCINSIRFCIIFFHFSGLAIRSARIFAFDLMKKLCVCAVWMCGFRTVNGYIVKLQTL